MVGLTLAAAAVSAAPALASFPYRPQGTPTDYKNYRLSAADPKPNDNDFEPGENVEWMYAADKEPGNEPVNSDPRELFGVRGAHIVDRTTPIQHLAWGTTTGRPDVTIAVLDSGIKWNDAGAMTDLRKKTRLNAGEIPVPLHDRGTPLEAGVDCGTYLSQNDANQDGVFNVVDYACDSRVERDPAERGGLGVGPADVIDPQDVLIAFSDETDADTNGFTDDIVGWDFLDNDNDPFDDVQYGHGTGEARDSTAEADNGGALGACPNCMSIHMRVGNSFIADVNRFAQAVIYAADNGALVVQEALGTLNNTKLSREAVEYAYRHGVVVIASAADEAAEHHNWPSSLPHVVLVNSVTKYDIAITPSSRSYLQFNGCTNFSSKITVSIPSTSCSSDATGRGSGMAGLIYSAALNAQENGNLLAHPRCRLTNGDPCPLSANEVRQIMASGTIGSIPQVDDINFASQPEPSCTTSPVPSCTDPNLNAPYDSAIASPVVTTKRYPTRRGFDQFYGWGRVNMNRAVDALVPAGNSRIPPEVEITSPDWFAQIDPAQATMPLRGEIAVRRGTYRCQVLVAPGSQPNNNRTTNPQPGDFKLVQSDWCNGAERSTPFDGVLAELDLADLKARFPASAGDFNGREPGTGAQTSNGRPNTQPYGFTVEVVATRVQGAESAGRDRRNLYLHKDQSMSTGFPRHLTGDGESSPLFVDLDGNNRNELIMATADGQVHAYRANGSELPGWPVRGDGLPLHTGGRAFQTGAVSEVSGSFLASVAAADLDRDGSPEIVGADLEGKVYVWNRQGERVWKQEAAPRFSGKPLEPFVDVRYNRANPGESKRRRTQHGFLASPVLADIDGNDGGRLEVIVAGMDRHVYAWNHDRTPVPGFPVIVVDFRKVASVDPETHAVTFSAAAGPALDQGSIIDTPAVGDITGDGRPEIVVGTNEEYVANQGNEGPYNSANFNSASVALLAQVGGLSFGGQDNPADLDLAESNTRIYALHPDGRAHPGGRPFLTGWPTKIGQLQAQLLPVVGEGVTGSPVIGPVDCPNGGSGPQVGTIPAAGPGYILNKNGQSCYGRESGRDIVLQTDFAASGQRYDTPAIPAVGHPAFGNFGGTVTFLAPAAGLLRAVDVAANEYQGGQDFVSAWVPSTGQFRPDWPVPVNDLQFLTGPSVSDIDPRLPGEELVSGTSSLDLAAFNAAGAPVNARWPRLTSDWVVANPLIGSFGSIDTNPDVTKKVVSVTRSGTIFSYRVLTHPCSPASWPRFHHDNANSGDFSRDAVSPGTPINARVSGGSVRFGAPGDDLLCGTADSYEVVTSDQPITGANFEDQDPVAGAPDPAAPGTEQSFPVPGGAQQFIGIRAVDEQGNVGPVAVVTVP